MSSSSSLGSLITNDQLLRSMPNIALALFLLHERFQPKWKPYIDILPDHFDTPLYFDYEQLNRLKPSSSFCKNNFLLSVIYRRNNYLGDVLTHIQRIARQYCYLHNLLKVISIVFVC
jgi:histone-lysine N-methyltransferase SETD3